MVSIYTWFEVISLILIAIAFSLLLKAKKRDISRYLKSKISGIFFLVILFILFFVLGAFISFLAIVAFIISFILLLLGFLFRKKVEIKRMRIMRVSIPRSINPIIEEVNPEETIEKLEKEVKKVKDTRKKSVTKRKPKKKVQKKTKKTSKKRR